MEMHIDTLVTQRNNHDLRDDELICSKSDLNGTITYANRPLCRISGFSEDELLGSPQDIMHHPDMPRTADAWMHDVVDHGHVWHAMVKYRCKNGDHYWVDTNISPQYGPDGRVIGYLSTWRKPSADQVSKAEALYVPLRQAEEDRAQHAPLSSDDLFELYRNSALYRAH